MPPGGKDEESVKQARSPTDFHPPPATGWRWTSATSEVGCAGASSKVAIFHHMASSSGTTWSGTMISETGFTRWPNCLFLPIPTQDDEVAKPGSRAFQYQIGRASCRDRVCQVRVELGGSRIINKKKDQTHTIATRSIKTNPE